MEQHQINPADIKKILVELSYLKQEVDKIKEVTNIASELGFFLTGFFVMGMPGETSQSFRKSIELAKELPLDRINVMFPSVFPGTPFYEQCIENNYIDEEEHTKTLIDYNVGLFQDYMIKIPTMTKEELIRHREMFYNEFIISRIKRKPSSLLYYLKKNFSSILKMPMILSKYIVSKINHKKN